MGETTKHIVATGRVQGVFFRNWTVSTANRLGIRGWVRNRRDGSVEILASGPQERIDEFLAACRQGPEKAGVDTLDIAEHAPFDGGDFTKRETA